MAADPSAKENVEYKLLRHDLYNPINQIVGYSELLTEELEAGESIDPDDLAKIGTSARVLLEMIRSRLTESELQSERHEAKRDSSTSVIQLKTESSRRQHDERKPTHQLRKGRILSLIHI
mgnify:FL=1